MTGPAPDRQARAGLADRVGVSDGGVIGGGDGRLRATLFPHADPSAPLLVLVHGGGCASGYFDIAGRSMLKAAAGRGHAVLLVDRPGHGGSAPPLTAQPITEAAALLASFVLQVAGEHLPAMSGWSLVGHSIGGAVALQAAVIAARSPSAVAVSGIGAVPTEAATGWFAQASAPAPAPAQDNTPPVHFFFGPEGTYDWSAPLTLRRVAQPWRLDEVREVLCDWPARFAEVADAIACPVFLALAEHEAIWRADDVELSRIAALFSQAPNVQCTTLLEGGHLYELHRRGPELINRQLSFLAQAAPPATGERSR